MISPREDWPPLVSCWLPQTETHDMRIDIWSDIVCPWCYVGKRRFERALDEFAHREAIPPGHIVHRSFQLNPSVPKDRTPVRRAVLMSKYGLTDGRRRTWTRRWSAPPRPKGSSIIWTAASPATRSTRTSSCTWPARAAVRTGDRAALSRLLHRTAVDLRRRLARRARKRSRMDAAESRTGSALACVRRRCEARIELARKIGISGVPFFLIDGKYGVSGAQPSEVFARGARQSVDRAGRRRIRVTGQDEEVGVLS